MGNGVDSAIKADNIESWRQYLQHIGHVCTLKYTLALITT